MGKDAVDLLHDCPFLFTATYFRYLRQGLPFVVPCTLLYLFLNFGMKTDRSVTSSLLHWPYNQVLHCSSSVDFSRGSYRITGLRRECEEVDGRLWATIQRGFEGGTMHEAHFILCPEGHMRRNDAVHW